MKEWPLSLYARKLALTITLVAFSTVHSRSAVEAWVQRYSHPVDSSAQARAMVTDKAGNVIVAGYSDGRVTGIDFLVVKYSGAGVPLWTNRFNGPGNDWDYACAVAVDDSGNVIVAGQSWSGSSGDYATVAYSGDGAPLWTNRFNVPGGGNVQANAVAVDERGNVFVTGSSATIAYSGLGVPLWTNSSAGSAIAVDGRGNVFVTGSSATVAYSGAGVPLWTNSDSGTAIAVDRSGNAFVTGRSPGDSSSDYETVAYSGAGLPLWTNRYDGPGNSTDQPNAIAVDDSGNVFVTGYSLGIGSSYDYATVAYSGQGVPLWTNRYNGSKNDSDVASAVAVNLMGDVFVTGSSFSHSGESEDFATVAYSGTGVPLWTNHYNGPGNGPDNAFAAAVDHSGNVFVAGESFAGRGFDFATIAYSGEGLALWTNRCNGPGNGADQASAVAVDSSGNVFVTGTSEDNRGLPDYATVAYSEAGVPLWTKRYDGPANGEDIATALAVDGSGNVFVTGLSVGSDSLSDYATVAYSGLGVPLWTNRFDGPENSDDAASAIAVDDSGNVFVTGRSHNFDSSYDFATVAYSGAGAPLWTNRYNAPQNGADEAVAIATDSSGNVFVTGYSTVGDEDSEYATVAYSGAGVPLWTNRYNGPNNHSDLARAIAVDSNGNVFVTGRSYGSSGSFDYATVAYSGAGAPLWTNRYDGPGNDTDEANAIAVDGSGNVFVTGSSFGAGSGVDYATVAYSGAGVPLWTNRYNGPANDADRAQAIAVDGSGNVFVTGYSFASDFNSDYVTVAYSDAGVPLWISRYNGPANGHDRPLTRSCLAISRDGAVVVTGASDGDYSPGTAYDYATIKYANASLSPIRLNFEIVDNQLVLSWTNAAFSLQSAPAVQGDYTDVSGATSPYTTPFSGAQRYFRLKGN